MRGVKLDLTPAEREEYKRRRNAERQKAWRDRQRIKQLETGEAPPRRVRRPKVLTALFSHREAFRAGLIAGRMEVALGYGLNLRDEAKDRRWLDNHPVGASYVLDVLSTAGLLDDFRRWRGDF